MCSSDLPEVKFHVFGTKHGEEKSLSNTCLLHLSVNCGDFIEQMKKKKNCHIHFNLKVSSQIPKKRKKKASRFFLLESASFCYW